MASSADYNFACKKCPRTFKLQEFYEKHQKVHQLKKQHVCNICGFVYGAAKGLEGHMETAHGPKADGAAPAAPSPPPDAGDRAKQEIPFGMGFHFLQNQGVLATANLTQVIVVGCSHFIFYFRSFYPTFIRYTILYNCINSLFLFVKF